MTYETLRIFHTSLGNICHKTSLTIGDGRVKGQGHKGQKVQQPYGPSEAAGARRLPYPLDMLVVCGPRLQGVKGGLGGRMIRGINIE